MNKNSSDIKPFYIYTNKDKLYIKNINEHTEKLANNIFAYCANIDNNKRIHICSIDSAGKLIHFSNNKGYWKKNIVCKAFNNIKNIYVEKSNTFTPEEARNINGSIVILKINDK